jgi:type IV secretory pathway TraG/TraD family ATPase VirD4
MDRDQRTSGLTSQLSPFAFGKTAALYNSTSPDIKIEEALKQNRIVYFQLPVLLAPFLGSATGKLVLQSLQSAIANRHRGPKDERRFFSVFLDDFSEYLYPGFVSVLNKSRSANVGVVFAHQALGDIEVLGESVSNAILTNSNVKVFMRGNDPKSAEHFSKIIGTKQATKTTERRKISLFRNQGTGDVSSRDVEQFVVHPNCFKKELGVGEAIMIIPHERGSKSLKIKFDRFPDLASSPLPDSIPGTPEGFAISSSPLAGLISNKKKELT